MIRIQPTKKILLTTGGGLILLSLQGTVPAKQAQNTKPNIIIILTDDMGFGDIGCYGGKFAPTPNIDRMAREGIKFTQYYSASPICSPSRTGLLTGMAPAKWNITSFLQKKADNRKCEQADFLDPSAPSIAKILKSAGYATGHFGKWHIGCDPSAMGYDFSDGFTTNAEGGLNMNSSWLNVDTIADPKLVFSLTEKAIRFIETQKKLKNPFFLQLSHYATHRDIVCTPESYSKFDAIPKGQKHNLSTFAAMLFDLDRSIGRLVARVEELGLTDNTYIFFLADNGGVPFFPPNSPEKEGKKGMGYNLPLQRGKWDLFEGGVRVPFMVKGPGIKPNTFCDTPVITYDLLPTIADLVKFNGKLPAILDGHSIKPLLEGETKIGDRSLFFHSPYISATGIGRPTSAIREGKFKLIKYLDNGQVQLFDLNNDIGEQKDLSKQNTVKAKLLESKLEGYLQSVHAITFEELKKVINVSAKSD